MCGDVYTNSNGTVMLGEQVPPCFRDGFSNALVPSISEHMMSSIEHHVRIRDLVNPLTLSRISILKFVNVGSGLAFSCDPLWQDERTVAVRMGIRKC